MPPVDRQVRKTVFRAAILVWVVSRWLPFGDYLLYPFTLFTTWVHEMGHGLTALLVGGRFAELEIFANASGLAMTASAPGWRDACVSAGGLLAPPIVGAAVLGFVHGPRRAKIFLTAVAAALLVSLALWVRSPVGVVVVPALALLCGWAGWRAFRERPERRVLLAQVLGVVLAVDTATRMLRYVFMKTVEVDGEKRISDIARIAEQLGGHYALWGLLVAAIALGLLALGARRALRAG